MNTVTGQVNTKGVTETFRCVVYAGGLGDCCCRVGIKRLKNWQESSPLYSDV